MSSIGKAEWFLRFKDKYRKAGRFQKSKLLDELSELHGIHRKTATRLLSSQKRGKKRIPGKCGRRSKYDTPEFIRALRLVWKETDFMCSRLLHSAMPEWVPSTQRCHGGTWLTTLGVTISMNPKGSPWCNASQESFFGRYKVEFGDFERFDTYADLLEERYAQLSYFSNVRIKTKLKMAPAEFRARWEQRQAELSTSYESPPHPLFPPSVLHLDRAGCAALELRRAPLRAASADSS